MPTTVIPRADAIIIGGGIVGCSVAHALAPELERVVVLERRVPGCEASKAAAGILSPQSEAEGPGPFLDLCRASLQQYQEFVGQLQDDSGIDIGFVPAPVLQAALTTPEADVLDARARWQASAGLSVERLTSDDVQRVEPLLSPSVQSGLLLPDEARVDNVRLVQALVGSARLRGAEMVTGITVEELLVDGRTVRGVRTHKGEWHAPLVIVAAGSWSGIPGAGFEIPIKPVRGQIVVCEGPADQLQTIPHSSRVYIVPRDGRVLLGSTVEEAGFDARLTPDGVSSILQGALELMPSLAQWTFKEGWGGLRPAATDDWPLLGPTPVDGLHLATGHFRNGILLAPLTGAMVAATALGQAPPFPIEPFLIERLSTPQPAIV